MVRQWQEPFYDKNYSCSPILSPDFVKLADAFGIAGAHSSNSVRCDADRHPGPHLRRPFLIEFQVEKEDGVYPMIAPGAALHEMIRRPDAILCLRPRRLSERKMLHTFVARSKTSPACSPASLPSFAG